MSSRSSVADAELAAPLQQVDRTFVRQKGRKLSYFGGCDYFRLASHPAVLAALEAGLRRFGLSVAASRRTTGNHVLYHELESRLAWFFGVETACVVSNGYLTNLAVAQTLAGEFARVFIDERAHGSLQDAAPLFECPVIRFPHRDGKALAKLLRGQQRPVILTDGLFSHDGELAPLPAYLEALPRSGRILLDDAHGTGTLGEQGRGTVEELGVNDARIIQTIALSKAFGGYGGAILGSRQLRDQIQARSRIFNGNTPLPLPLVCGVLRALELLDSDARFRTRLRRNTNEAKYALRAAGWSLPLNNSPIISVIPRRAAEVETLRRRLLRLQIFPSFICYPGGPARGYFRFAISSEHTETQVHALVAALTGTHELSRL